MTTGNGWSEMCKRKWIFRQLILVFSHRNKIRNEQSHTDPTRTVGANISWLYIYRANVTGIHYEYSGEKNSMTTTHDRTYGANEFPPQRLKSTVEDDNCGLTTMKTDFIYKRISSPVVVSHYMCTRCLSHISLFDRQSDCRILSAVSKRGTKSSPIIRVTSWVLISRISRKWRIANPSECTLLQKFQWTLSPPRIPSSPARERHRPNHANPHHDQTEYKLYNLFYI